MSTDPVSLLRDELQRSLNGPAWHGPALLETLSDVTADEAHARPLPGVHSIGELAAHTLAWIEEVTRRLRVGRADEPERGDWPDMLTPDETSWRQLVRLIEAAGASLDATLAEFPAARLHERVGGQEKTYALTLHGVAQHHAYHGGQISMLKHAMRRDAS